MTPAVFAWVHQIVGKWRTKDCWSVARHVNYERNHGPILGRALHHDERPKWVTLSSSLSSSLLSWSWTLNPAHPPPHSRENFTRNRNPFDFQEHWWPRGLDADKRPCLWRGNGSETPFQIRCLESIWNRCRSIVGKAIYVRNIFTSVCCQAFDTSTLWGITICRQQVIWRSFVLSDPNGKLTHSFTKTRNFAKVSFSFLGYGWSNVSQSVQFTAFCLWAFIVYRCVAVNPNTDNCIYDVLHDRLAGIYVGWYGGKGIQHLHSPQGRGSSSPFSTGSCSPNFDRGDITPTMSLHCFVFETLVCWKFFGNHCLPMAFCINDSKFDQLKCFHSTFY